MSNTYNPKAKYAVAHRKDGSYYDLNKMAWVFRPEDPRSKDIGYGQLDRGDCPTDKHVIQRRSRLKH